MTTTEKPTLKTSWDGHYMLPAFLGCVRWAMGDADVFARYRQETGDRYTVGAPPLDRAIDKATGADAAFIQRFCDWVEAEFFGTPADLETGDAA